MTTRAGEMFPSTGVYTSLAGVSKLNSQYIEGDHQAYMAVIHKQHCGKPPNKMKQKDKREVGVSKVRESMSGS